MKHLLEKALSAVVVSAGILAAASALTPAAAMIVTPGASSGEPGLYQIMDSLYGAGNYVQMDSNGTQHYANVGGTYALTFETRYAAHDASFGVETNGTTFQSLMSLSGSGTGTPSVLLTPSQQSTSQGGFFNFAYRDDVTGTLFSSDRTRNADGLDHMIAFQILGRANTFVLAWEDMLRGDFDYNDALFQMTLVSDVRVPEPASLALFGLGCLGAAAVGRRRRGAGPDARA